MYYKFNKKILYCKYRVQEENWRMHLFCSLILTRYIQFLKISYKNICIQQCQSMGEQILLEPWCEYSE
jgi:hypothetical protein